MFKICVEFGPEPFSHGRVAGSGSGSQRIRNVFVAVRNLFVAVRNLFGDFFDIKEVNE